MRLDDPSLKEFQEFCEKQARTAPHSERADACPHCHGTGYRRFEENGYEMVKRCICRKEKLITELYEKANIPRKFRNVTLDEKPEKGKEGFKPYGGGNRDKLAIQSQSRALKVCRKVLDQYLHFFKNRSGDDSPHGLMLYGKCGLGKTRLACAILCDLIREGVHKVKFIEYNELFKQIRFSFKSSEMTYQGVFDPLIDAKVLVIDDFGMEVSDNLVWILDNIGYIINERYTRNLPTILTSNFWRPIGEKSGGGKDEGNLYDKPSWEIEKELKRQKEATESGKFMESSQDRISYRLRSRISEMCIEVGLEGFDYRKRIAQVRNYRFDKG